MGISKQLLSGSTDGKQIVVGTSSTTIHAAHASAKDEIYLFCDNEDAAADHVLTIEWGGTTDVTNTIKTTIKKRGTAGSDGLQCVVAGLILTNSLTVTAKTDAASKLKISGYVNRIV